MGKPKNMTLEQEDAWNKKRAEQRRIYREKYPEKVAAQKKAYREKNRERLAEKERTRAIKRKELGIKMVRNYNKEKENERSRKRYISNRDKVLLDEKRRREECSNGYLAQLMKVHVDDCTDCLLEMKRQQLQLVRATKVFVKEIENVE